uniref:ribonuclease H n=1 Tax=Caenorhabditis tropicalis TaxID=1561998 RepID=A0A1I7TS43_9PELO
MSKFYGVAHGFQRGVFTEWSEAKKQIDKFPQPVYKKFSTEEEAQKYVDERKPKKVELSFPEPTHETYYAVAHGNVVGVFTDYNAVKEHIKNYPQPLHKKLSTLDEAIAYFHKFYDGKEEGKGKVEKTEKESKEAKPEKRESKRKAEKEETVEKKKKKK